MEHLGSLVDLIVRVTLLFAAAAGLAALMRRSSAAARHLVWTLAILASLALPLITYVAPRWELPLLPSAAAVPPTAESSAAPAPADASVFADRLAQRRPAAEGEPRTEPRTPEPNPAPRTPEPGTAFFWFLGFVIVLSRLALGSARMWWIARRARRLSDGSWLRLARRLAGAMGVRERVVFLEGAPTAMPMTWGVWRPRVLLPESAIEWPVARQRVVLLHELAHVKRRDCLTQLLAQAACAVYWFHPLAWFAAARLRAERERACDDLVLAAGTRGSDYADHLLDIARSMRSVALPTWAAVAMAHRSQLEGRLMAILDPEVPRRFPTRRRSIMLACTVAVLALPIAIVTPVPKAAEVLTVIESAPLPEENPIAAATAQPTPTPTPTPTPEPRLAEPAAEATSTATKQAVREALASSPIARVAVQAAAGALKDPKTREWLGSVFAQAVDGAAQGVKEGIAEGIAEGVAEAAAEGSSETVRRDPRAVAALVEALKDSDKEVREHAMQALARMRAPEALDAMRAALKDSNPSVREQAAFALGQYRDRASVDALAAALKDSAANVREQAVFALGQIRDPRAAEALQGALKDSSADVREQAVFALGQLRHSGSVDALITALKDSSADVREQAAFALGQIREERAVDALIGATRDENASVREQAVFALGQIRDPRAIDALTAALKDSNTEVRRHAAFALGQIRN